MKISVYTNRWGLAVSASLMAGRRTVFTATVRSDCDSSIAENIEWHAATAIAVGEFFAVCESEKLAIEEPTDATAKILFHRERQRRYGHLIEV